MTEQQYRVIADRDKGDNPKPRQAAGGDRLTYQIDANGVDRTLVRIECPVPTTDDTDYNAWHHGLPADVAAELSGEHPASLPTREQIDSAVGAVLFNVSNYPDPAQSRLWGRDIGPLREKVTAAVLALLSQPEPSEVEVEGSFFAVADLPDILARHMRVLDDAHRREKQHWIEQHEPPLPPEQRQERMCKCTLEPVLLPAEPVSIADMAPGTTFTATEAGDQMRFFVAKTHLGIAVYDQEAGEYFPESIDSSTIRDVTPPRTTAVRDGEQKWSADGSEQPT